MSATSSPSPASDQSIGATVVRLDEQGLELVLDDGTRRVVDASLVAALRSLRTGQHLQLGLCDGEVVAARIEAAELVVTPGGQPLG